MTITNNVIIGYPIGVSLAGFQSPTRTGLSSISRNQISATRFGVRLADTDGVDVSHNVVRMEHVTDHDRAAIELFSNAGDPLRRIAIRDNMLYSATVGIRHGINSAHSGISEEITIENNIVTSVGATTPHGSPRRGIRLLNASDWIIRGNYVVGFSTDAPPQ